jgi:hypothetical protein
MATLKRIGDYAVELGYCSRDDVNRAVRIQQDLKDRGFGHMLLGIVMVRYGIIDNGQLIEILRVLEHEHVEAILPS